MLVRIHRKIVFIHDNFIYASHLFGSTFKELPLYILPLIRKSKRIEPVHVNFFARLSGKNPPRPKSFYEQLEKIGDKEVSEISEKISEIRPRPIYEYSLRGLPRELFNYLVKTGYIWVIPYRNIKSIRKTVKSGKNIIEIVYKCPFTNQTRIFQTVYDEEVYDLIRLLCRNTGNMRC